VWAWILGGVVVLASFIYWESRTSHPSLDVKLFRDGRFSASIATIGLVFFASMGTFFFAGFYLQVVRDLSPMQAGAMFLPFAAGQMVFAPLSTTFVKRFGIKAVSAAGIGLAAVSFATMMTFQVDTPLWWIAVVFLAMGAGMANVMPPATNTIMATLPREKAGVGSAISNTVRQVAAALGVAVLGSVVAGVYRGEVTPAADALPAQLQGPAKESISGAYGVAPSAGPAADQLITAANNAFVNAMHWAAFGSTVVAVIGVVVALVWLPRRTPAPVAPPPVSERELVVSAKRRCRLMPRMPRGRAARAVPVRMRRSSTRSSS
jgi:predicted MFS family arabinose efflux permease